MKTKTFDTIILDGMYMDIQSIEFRIDKEELEKVISKSKDILKQNDFLSDVSINLFNFKPLQSVRYFDSTADDEDKTEDVESRIETETLTITNYGGIYYRGYSKWTSDYLEVEIQYL